MNGRNARKRMLRQIRTKIWRKQEKFARKKAEQIVKTNLCKEVAELTMFKRIKFIFTGKL